MDDHQNLIKKEPLAIIIIISLANLQAWNLN
jgi:hypothetical protein